MKTLLERTCSACELGAPLISQEEQELLLKDLKGWRIDNKDFSKLDVVKKGNLIGKSNQLIAVDHPTVFNNNPSKGVINIPHWIILWLRKKYLKKKKIILNFQKNSILIEVRIAIQIVEI